MRLKLLLALSSISLAACAGEAETSGENNATSTNNATTAENATTGINATTPAPTAFSQICEYTNPFSQGPECRTYFGEWDDQTAGADCDEQMGELVEGSCAEEQVLGLCNVEAEQGEVVLSLYGTADACGFAKLGCETFVGGMWAPNAACDDSQPAPQSNVFIPPELICTEPLDGEPVGDGPNGEVCTWQLISGATEEGRRFQDYASCDVVRTQRPYAPYPRPDDAERADERLNDPTYKAELDWVKSQIEATACVCCHATSLTPNGASNWDIEQPGNFMNGFYDSGLALGANWVNSEALGAFPADENNGFDREISGIPSTDPQRMRDFFIAELQFRGLSEADFVDADPFGGPLYDQIYYEPSACPDGVGIDESGGVHWEAAPARYIYILEEGSLSPTVPPNLDTPDGTIWRIDVAPEDDPLDSGSVTFGEVPEGATQVVPAEGVPTLGTGTYYLFVAADVGIPVQRCLFQQ